jgi:magnesium transporter
MLNSISHKGITWIDIQDPKENDITYLKENFNFHELVLEELIPPGHRQKVEHNDGYIFFILYYPIFHKESEETFPRELDILVTKTHIITSHYESIIPVKSLFDQINLYENAKTKYMSESTGHLLFYIMREILENTLAKLEHIEDKVNYIEEKIFKGEERKMVFEISITKRNIIDFRRILAPQQSVVESLVKEGTNFFGEELEPYFLDLKGTFGILWNEIQDHRETINALAETNESLLSTKINEVIKVFTIFSVVFLPLTLIASIWGMNISNMPLTENVSSFWIIIGIMVSVLVGMLGYFRSKKWL